MNRNTESVFRQRTSALLWLVLFVFSILLTSILVAGLVRYAFMRTDLVTSFVTGQPIQAFLFILVVSVLIGTFLTIIGGNYFLRPLHNLTTATKEIANGNFDVYVDAKGSNELVSLATNFNEMARELGSVQTLKSDFISNISHEFKTPITSIKGFAKRLLKNNLTDEQRKEYLKIIISESERLSRLSSNILLLSNLENYSFNSKQTEYHLDEQLRKTILLLEPQLQKKGLIIDIHLEPIRIKANEEILYHVWLNLLENAIKFSCNGGTVNISLRYKEDNAIVSIFDTGIGMDEEVKKHIFRKFYQADQSRSTEGNGLGLSLVKKILNIENGKITVNSRVGEGSEFIVSLPSIVHS